jgi:hypothetical protein
MLSLACFFFNSLSLSSSLHDSSSFYWLSSIFC